MTHIAVTGTRTPRGAMGRLHVNPYTITACKVSYGT